VIISPHLQLVVYAAPQIIASVATFDRDGPTGELNFGLAPTPLEVEVITLKAGEVAVFCGPVVHEGGSNDSSDMLLRFYIAMREVGSKTTFETYPVEPVFHRYFSGITSGFNPIKADQPETRTVGLIEALAESISSKPGLFQRYFAR